MMPGRSVEYAAIGQPRQQDASVRRQNSQRRMSSSCPVHTSGYVRSHLWVGVAVTLAVLGALEIGWELLTGWGDKRETCSVDTGGTCSRSRCYVRRGATKPCSNQTKYKCLCKEGYCARGTHSLTGGTCQLSTKTFTATVAPMSTPGRLTFPSHHGEVRAALCFSGGGSRSLSLSVGYLRALEDLGLMENVDAISAVSGGAWATAVYMFADMPAAELLGARAEPRELTVVNLSKRPAPLGATVTKSTLGIAKTLAEEYTPTTKLWSHTVGQLILAPFGLHSPESFLAGSEEEVGDIRGWNPDLKQHPFLTPREDRPKVFVMGATLLAPTGHRASDDNIWPLQMSPDYTGFPFFPPNATMSYEAASIFKSGVDAAIVGGGMTQSFAFGGPAPVPQQGGEEVGLPAPPVPFSLSDAIGISSAAFAGRMQGFGAASMASRFDPEIQIWPVTQEGMPAQKALTYKLGDGSILDDSGLLVMLQRGARRVVWFINTDTRLSFTTEFNWCTANDTGIPIDPEWKVTDQVYDKFGYGVASWKHNQVFPKEDMPRVLCVLQRLRDEGKPAVTRFSHAVLRNSWWGILGDYTVDVVYVYNEVCQGFVNLLPENTQLELRKEAAGLFPNYPFYHTVFNELSEPTRLSARQVNLLAAQGEYSIRENAQLFEDILFAPVSNNWWQFT